MLTVDDPELSELEDYFLPVDMLAHAIDTPVPATIILVSGDRDFAYAVSTLRLRRYRVVVISARETPVHPSLKAHASVFLDWHTDVLLAKIVDENRHFHLWSNDEARPLATSFPSRRYPMSPSPSSFGRNRFGPGHTKFDTMDHLPHDTGVSCGSLGNATTPERISKELNNAVYNNRSFFPSDTLVDEAQSPTLTLRASSRTGSAPAVMYSSSDFLPPSTILGSNHDFDSGNVSVPATLPSGPQTQSNAPAYFLPSPPIKGAQDLTSGNVGHPSTLLPNPSTPFSVQYPRQPLPPAAVPINTSDTLASPSSEDVKPASLIPPSPAVSIDSSKERRTATLQSSKSIPPGFEPLVQRLEIYRSQGVLRPFRSKVAVELTTQANGVYRRVGAERFGQYVDMAVKAGIVELGGREGGAWIALRPEWYCAQPT